MPKILFTIALILGINNILFSQPLTWQKSFNLINGDDEGWAVCSSDSSNIFVGGLTSHPGMGAVLKLNRFGDVIWQKFFSDSYFITDLLSLPDGGLIYSANGILRRLDKFGSTVWSVEAQSSYGLLLTTDSFLITPFYGMYKKYDLNGNLIWEKNIAGYPYFSECFEVNKNNYILIGGINHNSLLLNIDSSGNIIDSKQFLLNQDSYFSSIIRINNNFMISGGYNGNTDTTKLFVLKLNGNFDSTNFLNVFTNYPLQKNKLVNNNSKIYFFYNYINREINKECFIISSLDTNLNFIKKTIYNPLVNWTNFTDAIIYPGSNNSRFAVSGTTSVNGMSNEDIYVASIDTSLTPLIGIAPINSSIPESFELYQNYPNPFNPVTKIKFSIPNSISGRNELTSLKIYDILGKEIAVPVNEILAPGEYEITWDATGLSSGVYFYRFNSGEYIVTRKLILLK